VLFDINVDMGESLGRWRLGDDAALMPFVSSVNIACGFHAGDSSTMRETVRHAVAHDVQIGAHVGFPDILGFGRRAMALSEAEVRDACLHQIGALAAFARAEGSALGHVKPHGALYAMCARDPRAAVAVAEAVAEFDPTLDLLLLHSVDPAPLAAKGVRAVREAFVDLEYDAGGSIILERFKRAWAPDVVAARAVRLATEGVIDTQSGTLRVDAASACLHGDAPNAVAVAERVYQALGEAGVSLAPAKAVLA
jgi:UPF0271 protein